jgi:formylglycine-generating enzyme required for sulfatase activity
MQSIPLELGYRASTGDKDSLNKICSLIRDNHLKALTNAQNSFVEPCDGKPFSRDVRYRILEMSRSCLQLEKLELAELFRLFAFRGTNMALKDETWSLEVHSDMKRRFTIFHLNTHLKLPSMTRVCNSGYIPNRLIFKKGVSYLLTVETKKEEPTISLPIYTPPGENGPKELHIDMTPWKGLNHSFIWVPKTSCFIGGDIAARNSLNHQLIEIGPLAASRFNLRMGEYIRVLQEYGETSIKSRYYPTYMGNPLLKYKNQKWESVEIPIKKGYNLNDIPVIGVDFQCAEWFYTKFQLPDNLYADLLTEIEWEALSRGPDERLFPWGNIGIPGFSNIRHGNQKEHGLESVGFRITDISAYGLCDCCGNAEEWCKPAKGITDTSEEYPIAKGGSWYNPEQASRLASRVIRKSDYRHTKLTFRIAIRIKKNSNPNSRSGIHPL